MATKYLLRFNSSQVLSQTARQYELNSIRRPFISTLPARSGRRVKLMYQMEKRRSNFIKYSKLRNPRSIFKTFLLCSPLFGICYAMTKMEEYKKKESDIPNITANSAYATYITSGLTITERLKEYTKNLIMQILSNEKVKEKGVVLVVGILKEPQAQQATVELLNNVLCDQKFIYRKT